MSRTKRAKLPRSKWFRSLSHKNQLVASMRAVDELEDEGYDAPSRVRWKANPGSVVTNYDDITISARMEQWEN